MALRHRRNTIERSARPYRNWNEVSRQIFLARSNDREIVEVTSKGPVGAQSNAVVSVKVVVFAVQQRFHFLHRDCAAIIGAYRANGGKRLFETHRRLAGGCKESRDEGLSVKDG